MEGYEQPKKVLLECCLNPMQLRNLKQYLERSFSYKGMVETSEYSYEFHLDITDILGFVGTLFGIVGFIIQVWDKVESKKWTVEKIKNSIVEAAVSESGSENISNFRFLHIKEFLLGKSDFCKIIVDIDDEDYTFLLFRDGDTALIKVDLPNSTFLE